MRLTAILQEVAGESKCTLQGQELPNIPFPVGPAYCASKAAIHMYAGSRHKSIRMWPSMPLSPGKGHPYAGTDSKTATEDFLLSHISLKNMNRAT